MIVAAVVVAACGAKKTSDTATGTTTQTATPAAGAAGAPGCPAGPFPSSYSGAPSALDPKQTIPAGYFIWNDSYGWHVRVVGGGAEPAKMDGTITSSAKLSSKPELKPDARAGTVSTTDTTITFSLTPGATPVGFDFAAGCASSSVKFELMSVYGTPQPVDGIYVGRSSKAIDNPFVVARTG